MILEKDQDQELQATRTKHGECARCGLEMQGHLSNGDCADGKGSFAWCHSLEDMEKVIAELEVIVGLERLLVLLRRASSKHK